MNTGKQTVEWLFYEQLKIDEKWAIRTSNGFRWWADNNVQTVEGIRQMEGPEGKIGYLIYVRTELLNSLELSDSALIQLHSLLMPFASMMGPVYDEENKIISLRSPVRVYDATSEWMNPLISMSAVLQIGEAL